MGRPRRTTWRTWRITPTRRAIGRGSVTTRRAWVSERSACTRPRSLSNTSDAHSKRRARSANPHRVSSIASAPRRTRCSASSIPPKLTIAPRSQAAAGDGDRDAEWQGLLDLGFVWLARDYARAGIFFEQSLALAEALGDVHKIAHSLNRVGNWHVNLDEPGRGLELHQRALNSFRELGDAVGIAQTLDLLGVALLISGQRQQALDTLGQASAAYRRVDDRGGLASVLATRAHLRCASHVYDVLADAAPASKEALPEVEEALALAQAIGSRSAEAYATMRARRLFVVRRPARTGAGGGTGRSNDRGGVGARGLAVDRACHLRHDRPRLARRADGARGVRTLLPRRRGRRSGPRREPFGRPAGAGHDSRKRSGRRRSAATRARHAGCAGDRPDPSQPARCVRGAAARAGRRQRGARHSRTTHRVGRVIRGRCPGATGTPPWRVPGRAWPA